MTIARCLPLVASLAVFAAALPAQTAPPSPGEARWEWAIAPMVFAPSQSGSVALTGFAFPGQMTDPGAGAALNLQGRLGDWAFVVDGYYLGLTQEYLGNYNNPGGGGLDSGATSGNQWSLQLLALKRLARSIEVAFGVAGNGVRAQGHAYGTGTVVNPGPYAISTSETKGWALPVVGARWTPVDKDRWRVALFGEAGYFGSTNKMWQLVPSLGYRVGPVVEIAARYRWLNTMYKASDAWNVFAYDVHSYGPELAVALRF